MVSALLDGGASLAAVADLVGHANPATTATFYARVNPEARDAADEVVARYLGTETDDQVDVGATDED